jgi:RibD C-terminal domain
MVLDGEVVEEVAKLRQRRDGDIVVHSSAQLVQTLLEYDLVDELRLMIFPKVVGLASACLATPAAPSACGLPTPGRSVTGRRPGRHGGQPWPGLAHQLPREQHR